MAAVRALTMEPTPYVMPSPERAEPIRPFGVVPSPDPDTSSSTPSSSDSCSGSFGRDEIEVNRRVRGRPRSSSSSSSVPGRERTPRAQLMISSRLRDDADDATIAATGECDASRECREFVRPDDSCERRVENCSEANFGNVDG